MKLYLVQHGEAVSAEIDPDRPLSEQGQRDGQALAEFLSRGGVSVQRLWHSGKTRAAQIAQLLAPVVLVGGQPEPIAGIAPNDEVTAFARRLLPPEPDTMLVGHLPFLGKLVSHLLVGDLQRELVGFQPGSLVCLETTEAVSWRLVGMLRPELLR